MSGLVVGPYRKPAILVVDDTEGEREVARRTLERSGYQLWDAADGIQALGYVADGLVDAVVTDIRMPGMDGWEPASHLKGTNPHLPILFMTGYDAHLGRGLPGPVLSKPFGPSQLLAAVSQLLTTSARPSSA